MHGMMAGLMPIIKENPGVFLELLSRWPPKHCINVTVLRFITFFLL